MKNVGRYILFALLAVLMTACRGGDASKVGARSLADREAEAEKQTAALCDALLHNAPMDSIRAMAERDPDILFYVFDARQMVYWSSNRLSSGEV